MEYSMETIVEKISLERLMCLTTGKRKEYQALTTLLAEVGMVGKNKGNRVTTDEEAIPVIKKFISNIDETRKLIGDNNHEEFERQLYSTFLPAQLSEDQIGVMVELLKQQGKNKGEIMKWFKENHAGLYDGKYVSSLV